MHSIPTPRCTLLAREHEPTSEMFGEVKRQNPPCAHWPGDLGGLGTLGVSKYKFQKKRSRFEIQLVSCKIQT